MEADKPPTQPPSQPAQPTHKITIYGATSFVAHYVIEYLLSAISTTTEPILITFAGRNQSKLQSLQQNHSSTSSTSTANNKLISIDTFVAECSDGLSLSSMAQRTDVVINCAGPYSRYGSLVVEACATSGTDYVDITGEVDWVADMSARFHSAATKSGARIVSMCGFDSIPSDIAVFRCVDASKEKWGEEDDVVTATTWHACRGLMNGGTLHTALDMTLDFWNCVFDGERYRKVPFLGYDPYILMKEGEEVGETWRDEAAWREWMNQIPSIDDMFNRAVSIPFFMAVVNAKVVYASALALKYSQKSAFTYGERFFPLSIETCRKWGSLTIIPSLLFLLTLGLVTLFFKLPYIGKRLALLLLPPGTGSPDIINRKGYADVYAKVTTSSGKVTTTHVKFQGDPGNLVTAQCVVESALCLLFDKTELLRSNKTGFGTPAEMLGRVLIKRFLQSKVRKVIIETTVADAGDEKLSDKKNQ